MPKISFQTSLLFAPLAYAIHHAEENLILDFRVWRLSYFPDNNALSTEAMVVILMGVTFVYLIINAIKNNRLCAALTITFLMSSQVTNTLFHAAGTIIFQDYSPGLFTGVILYIPVNILICRAAIEESLVTAKILPLLFVAGAAVFGLFEALGPIVLLVVTVATWVVMMISAKDTDQQNSAGTVLPAK